MPFEVDYCEIAVPVSEFASTIGGQLWHKPLSNKFIWLEWKHVLLLGCLLKSSVNTHVPSTSNFLFFLLFSCTILEVISWNLFFRYSYSAPKPNMVEINFIHTYINTYIHMYLHTYIHTYIFGSNLKNADCHLSLLVLLQCWLAITHNLLRFTSEN